MTWLMRLLNVVLLAAAAASIAHWFWIFAAPAIVEPPDASKADPTRPVDMILRANLFGASPTYQSILEKAGIVPMHV